MTGATETMAGVLKSKPGGLVPREWDALIGIVTAIIGNALISLALNIQRYAHIRLSQDRLQRQRSWRSQRRKKRGIPGMPDYGTQIEAAEERAKLNRRAPEMDERDSEHVAAYHADPVNGNGHANEADERTPLKVTDRSGSDTTVRPDEKDEEGNIQTKSYLKSPYWWLGIILMTTGEAGNFIAYGFAPASIVSPLGVVALVCNCIIAPLLLKESFRQRDFWGVLIAIGGAVTVVLSANMKDPKLGPGDIWNAITQWEFELYLGLTAAAIVVLIWASPRYGHRSVFIDLGLVGLFGGYTALSTKGVASLLTDTIWRAVTFPIFYLLIAVLIVTAIAQIRYVNKALQRFDSTRVVPTQFVCFTLSVIVGSAVLYREFESASAEKLGKFVGGCALTFLGTFLITSGKRDNGLEDNYDEETGEIEGIHLVDGELQEDDEQDEDEEDHTALLSRRISRASGTSTPRITKTGPGTHRDDRPATPVRTRSQASEVSLAPSALSGISPFSENPWAGSEGGLTPRASTSTSTPAPTSATAADARGTWPGTPSRRPPVSTSVSTPQTRGAGAPPSISRNSMSRLLPGPISAPLSSSLSAIVADQLRRGVDVTNTPRGANRASLRKTRSNILDAEDTTGHYAEPGLPSAEEAERLLRERKGRTRSISGALQDIFSRGPGGERSKAASKDRDQDEESGAGEGGR